MNPSRSDRRVLTFYSFKGGVGRTMTLANVGWRLAARHGLDVVLVDWDLEAPGLHTFFDIPRERLASARGLLDYFDDWARLASEGAPSPPTVTDYVLRVDGPEWSPPHGSLSLVLAGRMDAHYGPRVHQFDVRRLYRDHAGAAAVEHLRAGLVERFGMVLVDSRTGLTDIGGVCTVQLPDRVMLMTVPSEQSLAGIERVAHDVIDPSAWRAERRPPGNWVALCRMPYIEETELARRWVDEHRSWFAAGVAKGLWRTADHPNGLDTIRLPHTSRWGFGERILWGDAVDRDDPLARAYEQLASRVLMWAGGLADSVAPVLDVPRDVLQLQVSEADKRGDAVGGIVARFQLGLVLLEGDRLEEATAALEQALLLAKGHEIEGGYMALRYALGRARLGQKRYAEAQGLFEEVLDDIHAAGTVREQAAAALLEAVDHQVAAGEAETRTKGEEQLKVADALRELSKMLEAKGDLASAHQHRDQAVAILVEELGPLLLAIAHHFSRVLKLPSDIEMELVLDTFAGLVRNDAFLLRQWNPERGTLKRYVSTVARNLMIDRLRRLRREVPAETRLPVVVKDAMDSEARVKPEPEMKELADMALAFLRNLCTEEEWRLLELTVLEEHSAKEVAADMGVSVDAVYQRKHRLLERLRAIRDQILAERQAS